MVASLPADAQAQVAQPSASPGATSRPQVLAVLYELILRDGSRLYGDIERQDDVEVVFRTQAGVSVTARRAEILTLRQVTGQIVNGEFQRSDPNATRLFFAPTGRSLKKGQTYLGVYEFLMPFVQVGVTDRFSVGGGTPLIFGFDESERPFWITPKLQVFDSASTQIAVGAFHAFNVDGAGGGGIGYVVGTRSVGTGSVTLGGGVAYGSDGGRSGIVMVGGERQVRRNLKVMTENYIWKGGTGVVSAGVRFFGERLSADLALAVPVGADGFVAFPVVNFVYVF